MKKRFVLQKATFIFIAGYILPALARKFLASQHIITSRSIESSINLLISHIDISTLSSIETFMLANITAFIAVYDFMSKRKKKKPEEKMPASPGTSNSRRRSVHGKRKK